MPRGFDELSTPAGRALVIASLLLFVALCALGSAWMRRAVARDREARQRFRDQQIGDSAEGPREL